MAASLFRGIRNPARNLCLVLSLTSLFSLAAFVHLYGTNQPAAYFLMPTRLWELGAGCLVTLGLSQNNYATHLVRRIPPLMLLVGIIGTFFVPPSQGVVGTIAVVILTAALIVALHRPDTLAFRLLTEPKVRFIGLISYSLYLWHWAVLVISRWTIGMHPWAVPFQVALMLLLATASYRYIETPLRRAWNPFPWRVIVAGIFGLPAGSMLLSFIIKAAPSLSLDRHFPTRTYRFTSQPRSDPDKHTCHMGGPELTVRKMAECLGDQSQNPPARHHLYVIGDSHADQYVASLRSQIPEASVRSFTAGWGCGFVGLKDIDRLNLNSRMDCSLYNNLNKYSLSN